MKSTLHKTRCVHEIQICLHLTDTGGLPITDRSPVSHLRAVNGARTRDPQLGKLMLYQLSYYRVIMIWFNCMTKLIHFFVPAKLYLYFLEQHRHRLPS